MHWHVFARVVAQPSCPAFFIGSLFLAVSPPSAIIVLFSHAPADQPRPNSAEDD